MLVALIASGATFASPASAASQSYCGVGIPSTTGNNWTCGVPPNYQWSYTLAYYPGGGNIQDLRAGLQYTSVTYAHSATYAKTSSVCHYTPYDPWSQLRQYDGGTAHTIDGSTDTSTGHTGCI